MRHNYIRIFLTMEYFRKGPATKMDPLHLLIARIRGFINGVNPKWGTKTVFVSDQSGDIVKLKSRRNKGQSDDSAAEAFD